MVDEIKDYAGHNVFIWLVEGDIPIGISLMKSQFKGKVVLILPREASISFNFIFNNKIAVLIREQTPVVIRTLEKSIHVDDGKSSSFTSVIIYATFHWLTGYEFFLLEYR